MLAQKRGADASRDAALQEAGIEPLRVDIKNPRNAVFYGNQAVEEWKED